MASALANTVENLRQGLECLTGLTLPGRAAIADELLSKVSAQDIERTETPYNGTDDGGAYETNTIAYRIDFTPQLRERLARDGIEISAERKAMLFELEYERSPNLPIIPHSDYRVVIEFHDGDEMEIPLTTTNQAYRAFAAVEDVYEQGQTL